MAAINFGRLLGIFVIPLLFSLPACASEDTSPATMLTYLHNKAASDAAELNKKIDKCTEEQKKATAPRLDLGKLKKMGVTRPAIGDALFYLSNRNFYRCEGNTRLRLAYDIGRISIIADKYDLKPAEIKNLNRSSNSLRDMKAIVYPSPDETRKETRFFQLSDSAKSYLNKAVGAEPFDFLETIEQNNVFRNPER